jgi:predicted transposase/invertase (TIGR01784 family)
MTERTLYYWAREYIAGIKEGGDYGDLPRVITINIVNFDHIRLDQFHTAFRLREDTCREYVLTDVMEIHFLNMVKFRRKAGKKTENTLERWLMFLDEYSSAETVERITGIDPAIAKAQRRLEEVTQNEEFRRNYQLRQKALSDWTTGINTALENGRKKGRKEGLKKGVINVAKNALSEGLSIDTIKKITGLDEKAITALKNETQTPG